MNKRDQDQLVSLLTKLHNEGSVAPKLPYQLWLAIGQLVPYVNVDLVISRDTKDFLLTYRKDEYWDAWHLPGGYIGVQESVEDACSRISLKELGIGVKVSGIITHYAWQEVKRVQTLTIVCYCKPLGTPLSGTFFTEIPDPTIKEHVEFIHAFKTYIDGR